MAHRSRRLLTLAAIAAATAVPATALAAPAPVIFFGHTSGPQEGVIGTMAMVVQPHRIGTDNGYFSKCGEVGSGWIKLSSKNTFSFSHQWPNGVGLTISGRVSGSSMTGQVRAWGGGCDTGTLSFKLHKDPPTA